MPLADLQQQLRDALVGHTLPPVSRLTGGQDPLKRLAVHQRHFEASLAGAIIGRFPATGWLAGATRIEAAARLFVHQHPPLAPCIAEYGQAFPAFLATWPETVGFGFLPDFAALDWQLGRLAVCVEAPALNHADLARHGLDQLLDAHVTLQDGLYLTHASWPLDELMQHYLADAPLHDWRLRDDDVRLQVTGSRGSFGFSRLAAGDFIFRQAIQIGEPLGDAASRALDADAAFAPAAALGALIEERLITGLT